MSQSESESGGATVRRRSFLGRCTSALRFLVRWGARLVWGLVAVGLLLRLTIQDRFHPWALIYYLTPIPSLALWVCLAGWMWQLGTESSEKRRWFSVGRWSGLVALVFLTWGYCSEFVERAQPPGPNELQFVFWNTARVPVGVEPVAKTLRNWNPQLIGLVEANTDFPEEAEKWIRELAGYRISMTHFGGLLAVKGEIRSQVRHPLMPTSWCEQFDVTVEGQDFTVLLVDISAQLTLTRRQPLQELAELAGQFSDRPLIIMGDFNTPDDSPLLAELRKKCQHAIRERGTGYAATWPTPLPVLTLDQVWVNNHVPVSQIRYRWSMYSDHRPAVASVSFKDSN